MKFSGKGVVSVAAATTLALALSAPAFAAVADTDGTGNYEGTLEANGSFDAVTTISAEVAAPDAKVISVTVPSTLALPVGTKVGAGGKPVLDVDKTPSQTVSVKNSAESTTAVKVAVSSVAETPDAENGAYLSSMLKVLLSGPDTASGLVLSKDGTYDASSILASKIAAGADASLVLSAEELAANQEVEAGSYTLKATLKVSPVD